ncbi:hypothetical protein GCM10027422_06890 [Hymenobacter arcticus]
MLAAVEAVAGLDAGIYFLAIEHDGFDVLSFEFFFEGLGDVLPNTRFLIGTNEYAAVRHKVFNWE